ELMPRPSGAVAVRVAALDREPLHDAMEREAVEEALLREEHETRDGIRSLLGEELDLEGATGRVDRRDVLLVRIEELLGIRRGRELRLRLSGLLRDRTSARHLLRRGDGRFHGSGLLRRPEARRGRRARGGFRG